jgi:hypothetical protein
MKEYRHSLALLGRIYGLFPESGNRITNSNIFSSAKNTKKMLLLSI